MKQWHFYDKVYRRWVVLMIGDFEELKTSLKDDDYSGLEELAIAKGYCIRLDDRNNTTGQRCYVVWMPKFDTATLVHELTHLTMKVFEQVGVPINHENTEAFAFYTEFWFNEMRRAARKWPDGNKPKDAKA